MTVYCPSCGKPNTDEASNCIGCGAELAKKKKARFKGTMMMSGVGGPGAPTPGAGGAPAPGGAAPPPGAAPAPAPGAPAAAAPPKKKKDLAFQKTMLGPMTAPPGATPGGAAPAPGGFGAPPAGGAPAPAGGAAPAPAAGGFGAPPAGGAPAPAAGGFGAPPAGGAAPAPAAGGFGAPAGGGDAPAPAAGGFGAPPAGGAPAGGGFGAPAGGAPAGGAPAGGGFGAAPAGGAPAGGGFGAPPAGPPPGGPAAAPAAEGKSKTPMIIGGCCLLLLLISCAVGGWFLWKAKQVGEEAVGELGGAMYRITGQALASQISGSCAADPSGASAQAAFHPQVFSQYQGIACQLPGTASSVIGDGNRSTAEIGDDGRAASVGTTPEQCGIITVGAGKMVICAGRIAHLENPTAFQ